MPFDNPQTAVSDEFVAEALRRGIISISNGRIIYHLRTQFDYDWTDPEEWVRAFIVSYLVIGKSYPSSRIRLEVAVPRRTPNDFADVVVYRDDRCAEPYLVVETKASGQRDGDWRRALEQMFGNSNSLRAPFALCEEGDRSDYFDVANFPPTERSQNRLGPRNALPEQYGEAPHFPIVAGRPGDIHPADAQTIGSRVRRAHYIIWSGGRRDPLESFDEWSKLLFGKVIDERNTPTGQPRRFQVGARETSAAVANRVHQLFSEGTRADASIFPPDTRIELPDSKIAEVVRTLQEISFTQTEVDAVGRAFEEFFGSVFRGELGQYFTMRQLARFTVAVMDITHQDYVLDPTCGSGGFLLEALLQTWHRIDAEFLGQRPGLCERLKTDFALTHVYGVELHSVLARICKINLMLHHDGHTNIEANRSCLDSEFTTPRLNSNGRFSRIVGNPPFGDEVKAGSEDHLGSNTFDSFTLATGRPQVDSEQLILERSIQMLEPGGRLGMILPDGLFNNQGEISNCPRTRTLLARSGFVEAIVSLPDHAFRRSGAQNKTSILFFRKFPRQEALKLDRALATLRRRAEVNGQTELSDAELLGDAFGEAGLSYKVFLAEANHIGYSPTGARSESNDLYRLGRGQDGSLAVNQSGTLLGEWRVFRRNQDAYRGRQSPDCMAMDFGRLWAAHPSHRVDPKYHLFQRDSHRPIPRGWVRNRIGAVMRQRTAAERAFDLEREYLVLTVSQTGELRPREAGKGNNPSNWSGEYFSEVSPGSWYAAHTGDVVFSSIDLWKGCIAVVGPTFDGGLVTKEYPIYEVIEPRLTPEFLQSLLRSRYYQRAFRAITTGHSNRRRTQTPDFEALEIAFPADPRKQRRLIRAMAAAREEIGAATSTLRRERLRFSNVIDGRGDEDLPNVETETE